LKADNGAGEMYYVHCDMRKEEDIIVSAIIEYYLEQNTSHCSLYHVHIV